MLIFRIETEIASAYSFRFNPTPAQRTTSTPRLPVFRVPRAPNRSMEPTSPSLTLGPEYLRRFGGVARLFGQPGLERLARAHVAVVGVGGVGSWTVEALARSGLGALTMIDLDDVCVTNTNRQLPALDGSFGRSKAEVLAERALAIQPECRVEAVTEFFTESSAERLLSPRFDFVVDAIDKLSNKCLLIASCHRRGIPVITVGGAGGKRDGTAVRVADLAESEKDNLLKFVRRKLRQDYGFPRELGAPFGVPCIYSPEPPVYPWANGTVCAAKERGSELTLDCASGFGTAAFVTAAFGFAAAGEVVRRLTDGTPKR
jgi:tRNA A37 threonylcarbamoyladenosine dehydratase